MENQSNRVYNHDDFDLDQYIEDKSRDTHPSSSDSIRNPQESVKRNLIAIGIFLIIPAIIFFSWNPFESVFGSDNTGAIQINVPAPDIRVSPVNVPDINETAFGAGFVNYMSELNDLGLGDQFDNTALQAMYNSGVPVDYINSLDQSGLLNSFSYPAIIALYSSDVTVDYVNNIKDLGLINDLSYPAVIAFSSSGVTISYLEKLKELGILEDLSFPGIVALNGADVPAEFLQILQDRNLLENMNFVDIINAYNADN